MLSDPQKKAAYDQYGHAGVDPNMRGGRPRCRRLWRLRRGLRRHLRRHLRRPAPRRWRPAGVPRRRPVLRHGNQPGRGGQRQGNADPHPQLGRLRHLQGHRRQARHQRQDLHHLPRPGRGADAPGLLQRAADLPALPRQRQDHPRALHHLQRPGQDQEAEDAGNQDPRRHRRRPRIRSSGNGEPGQNGGPPATSTSRSACASTTSSSARATTCTARCR
jgi:molecular chaperone DnaJ